MRMYARPARVVRITFREPAPHRRAHAATPGRETDGARPARPLLLASSLRASRVSSTRTGHALTASRENERGERLQRTRRSRRQTRPLTRPHLSCLSPVRGRARSRGPIGCAGLRCGYLGSRRGVALGSVPTGRAVGCPPIERRAGGVFLIALVRLVPT